jgi:2-amino-4-hydroxy-6-hydroxymethyldihydropteridine diphosphokinase
MKQERGSRDVTTGSARPTDLFVGVGSNLGDATANVRWALGQLGARSPGMRQSSLWRSSPVGLPEGAPDFVNAVVALDGHPWADPGDCLRSLQALEAERGRPREHDRGQSRTLDLDILLWGTATVALSTVSTPHPRMLGRAFVMMPLAEIAPDLIVPGQSATVAQICARLSGEVPVRIA